MDVRCGLGGSNNRFDHAALADGGRIHMIDVGDGFSQRFENLRFGNYNVSTRSGRPGIRVRPTIARGYQSHFGQAEVQHCPCRFADVLAQLRADKDDGRRVTHGLTASATLPAKSSKSLASVNSL